MRLLAVLYGLPDDGDTGRLQQLVELAQVVALLERGDAEGTLLGATLPRRLASRAGFGDSSVAAALLHQRSSLVRWAERHEAP